MSYNISERKQITSILVLEGKNTPLVRRSFITTEIIFSDDNSRGESNHPVF